MEKIEISYEDEVDEEEERRLDELAERCRQTSLIDDEELAREVWSCKVGDLLEVIATIEFADRRPEDENDLPFWSEIQPQGQTYRVADLKGRGFDLELVSGEGPQEIRAMNWEIPGKFKVLPPS